MLQKKEFKQIKSQQAFNTYQELLTHIYSLGYREMPLAMKNVLIRGWRKDTINRLAFVNKSSKKSNNCIIPQTRYASLSWGLFDEEIASKPIERYGRTLYDTKQKRIISFVTGDTLYSGYCFDPTVFAYNIDPLAHKFSWQSPYSSFGGNPIYNIDVGGAFQYPAKLAAGYTKSYPMLTKYLAQNVERDVMRSKTIMNGMSKYSEGNLTTNQVRSDTKWGEKTSPIIEFNNDLKVKDNGTGFYGRYDASTNTINISKAFADKVEKILGSDASFEDKQVAMYEFFGTLTHEEVHRGDYLDGHRQDVDDPSGFGSEPGTAFMNDVFESTTVTGEDRKKYRVQQGSIHGDSKELVQKKQAGGEGDVVPSVPK